MDTYYKSAPDVLLAKCDKKHEKSETIEVTTKYGKENENIVFNLIFEKSGFCYHSIVRAGDFNTQEQAKRRTERRRRWAALAVRESNEYYNKSNKDKDSPSLDKSIKVEHHSEKRHRKMIDDTQNNMGKGVQSDEKAVEHEGRAEYQDKRANTTNLLMPESTDFYEHKLEVAKEYHAGVKPGKYPCMHSYTLIYAKRDVNEAQKNYDFVVRLWGDV